MGKSRLYREGSGRCDLWSLIYSPFGPTLTRISNFRIPLQTMFAYSLAAPIVGMAQGALEAFEEHMGGRVAYTTGERMAENAPVHIVLSEAEAEVHSARLIMESDAGRQSPGRNVRRCRH